MEDRIMAIERKQQELTDAIMEVNGNLASMGFSTTESIKAIMEGFKSVNTAMHGMMQNFTQLEQRVQMLENQNQNQSTPFNEN